MERDRSAWRVFLPLLALFLLPAAPVQAWEIRADAPEGDFRDFHRRFSAAAYHYPRHGASPLGLVGFDVYADAAVDREFDDEPFAETVIDGDLNGDLLAFARVGARKGLPGGIDLGVAYGRALGGDIDLVSADLQWAIVEGGPATPALGLRLTGSRTVNAEAYELDQYGAEVLVSKGFAILTPYVGGGVVHSKGTLTSDTRTFEDTHTRGIFYGGLTLNLLLPKITVEVEKAEVVQWSARISIGL
jgi:hypothetical protein